MDVKEVFCRTRFVAFHQWATAPDTYEYLRNVHRHEFQVEVGVKVKQGDREVEFHHLKRIVDEFLRIQWLDRIVQLSCEDMAGVIGAHLSAGFNVTYVEVSEDGECGGRVIYG